MSNLLDLLVAVSSHNGQRVAQLMVLRSQSPETVINQDLFETKMDVFLRNVRQTKATIGSVRVSEILSTLFKMVRDHHIRLEGEFVNIAVSMMLIEGMGKQFMDRQIDLLDRIPPFLAKANGLPLELLSKMANSKRQKMGTEPSGFMENFRMSLLI